MEKQVTENSIHLQSMFDTLKEMLKIVFLRNTEATMFPSVEVKHIPKTLSSPVLIAEP